jgi:hypothetical protein
MIGTLVNLYVAQRNFLLLYLDLSPLVHILFVFWTPEKFIAALVVTVADSLILIL